MNLFRFLTFVSHTSSFCQSVISLYSSSYCTIASKIYKYTYLPISKQHSIIAIAYLLAHNISQICYCGQIKLQRAAVDCSFSNNLTPLGVTFILLAMVHYFMYLGSGRGSYAFYWIMLIHIYIYLFM